MNTQNYIIEKIVKIKKNIYYYLNKWSLIIKKIKIRNYSPK
jgi:hypothetical protein